MHNFGLLVGYHLKGSCSSFAVWHGKLDRQCSERTLKIEQSFIRYVPVNHELQQAERQDLHVSEREL